MDLNTLRKMRNTDFSKISTEFEKITTPRAAGSYGDDRVWKLEVDKAGNGTAVIRFLPRTIKTVNGVEEMDELPWIRIYNHGFQGPTGRWFIEECPSTIGKECPVCQANSELWNSGIEANKEIVRKRKRRMSYIANVLIISDPKHPENEGQVRLFKFGKKIFDKIMDKARPTFEDEDPVNVFDLWAGADFKLRQRKVEGYPNYDQSVFMESSQIADSDEAILEIVNRQYLLKEFTDPSKFKPFEELDKKMKTVLTNARSNAEEFESNDSGDDTPFVGGATTTSTAKKVEERKVNTPKPAVASSTTAASNDDDDDDTMAYFRNLVND